MFGLSPFLDLNQGLPVVTGRSAAELKGAVFVAPSSIGDGRDVKAECNCRHCDCQQRQKDVYFHRSPLLDLNQGSAGFNRVLYQLS